MPPQLPLILLVFFGFLAYAVNQLAAAGRRKQQNEMQRHILDRFSSTTDFVDFVRSPAGQKYAMGFAETASTSQNAILNSVRVGIVLLFGGIGFAFTNFGNEGLVALRIGMVLSCLGVGFLVSAAISYWLAKKFARQTKE